MNPACKRKANATKLLLPSDKRVAEAKEAAAAKAQEEASAALLEEQQLADKVRFVIRKFTSTFFKTNLSIGLLGFFFFFYLFNRYSNP